VPAGQPAAAIPAGHWQLVPRQRLFGSDELSALSPALAELVEPGYLELCGADAAALGVTGGYRVEVGGGLATLHLRINDHIPPGCAGYGSGLSGTGNIEPLALVRLRPATGGTGGGDV